MNFSDMQKSLLFKYTELNPDEAVQLGDYLEWIHNGFTTLDVQSPLIGAAVSAMPPVRNYVGVHAGGMRPCRVFRRTPIEA